MGRGLLNRFAASAHGVIATGGVGGSSARANALSNALTSRDVDSSDRPERSILSHPLLSSPTAASPATSRPAPNQGTNELALERLRSMPSSLPFAKAVTGLDGGSHVAVSSDGRIAVSMGAKAYRILVWSVQLGGTNLRKVLTSPSVPQIGGVKFNTLLCISGNGAVITAGFEESKAIAVFSVDDGDEICAPIRSSGGTFTSMSITNDGKEIYAPIRRSKKVFGMLRICAVRGAILSEWPLSDTPGDCAVSASGETVVYVLRGKKERRICVADGRTGKVLHHMDGFVADKPRAFIDFSGAHILGVDKGFFRLYCMHDHAIISEGPGPDDLTTMSAALSLPEGGGYLLSTEGNRSVVAWDIISHEPIARMEGLGCYGSPTSGAIDGTLAIAGDLRSNNILFWRPKEALFGATPTELPDH